MKEEKIKIPDTLQTIYTIGHSTRTLEEFILLLQSYEISRLVDVRTVPRSRHVPQFNIESLESDLMKREIKYLHLAALGGLRKPQTNSTNLAWHNASFRGYADYMQTAAFEAGLQELIQIASRRPTAIMCAEAMPWRCHRSLIADALIIRGWQVIDIMGKRSAKPRNLTDFAKVEGVRVTYPLPPSPLELPPDIRHK